MRSCQSSLPTLVLVLAVCSHVGLLAGCGEPPRSQADRATVRGPRIDPWLVRWLDAHGAEPSPEGREALLTWFDADVARLATLQRVLLDTPTDATAFRRAQSVFHAMGPRAVPALLSIAVHGTDDGAMRAARVLHHTLPKAQLWQEDNPWQKRWTSEDRRRLAPFERGLIERTQVGSERRRQRAWFLLAALPPEARSPAGMARLVEGVADEDPLVMRECCDALAASGQDRAVCVPPLLAQLGLPDADPDREDVVTGLLIAWSTRDPRLIEGLADAAIQLPRSSARRDLMRGLQALTTHQDPDVRTAAEAVAQRLAAAR